MPARKKISMRQIELLVEFAETHQDIALNRFSGGPLGSQAARRAWESLAPHLNAVAEGSTKTPDQWRRYWIEFKAKTKSKAADSRRNAAATGGGPNKLLALNELELRVMALVGPVAVEGLPGVRIPIEIPSTDDPIPPTIQMDVEWLEDVPSPIEKSQPVEPQVVERDVFQPPAAPLPVAPVEPQPGIEDEAIDRNPQQPVRPIRASRSQRQIRRNERVPRWAYDLEMRRIAAEERFAAAQEQIAATQGQIAAAQDRLAAAMEGTLELMREIRDDVHNYTRSNN